MLMRTFEQQQYHQHMSVAWVDVALTLMDMSNHGCSLHKNKSCTYREDSGANRTPNDKEVIDIVNDKTRYGNDSQAGSRSISSFKEKSSKKVIPDANCLDVVMLPETKPSRKPRLTSVGVFLTECLRSCLKLSFCFTQFIPHYNSRMGGEMLAPLLEVLQIKQILTFRSNSHHCFEFGLEIMENSDDLLKWRRLPKSTFGSGGRCRPTWIDNMEIDYDEVDVDQHGIEIYEMIVEENVNVDQRGLKMCEMTIEEVDVDQRGPEMYEMTVKKVDVD
ncbi:hypothetical protein EZV62_007962 [Acer yangbiense]|uniref:Uncharacterized protein n=1 Tax=Acer yangbiense TaxID=1000413 RepID=A0A5C7IBT3_9ROSI|nr:hypothetical protein EZV62_007962 [Acer yangbiense]